MPREVNENQAYQDKIVKLIPTEIVGAYMVLAGIIPASSAKVGTLAVSIVLLVLTPLYLWRISKVTNAIQLIVTTVSFAVLGLLTRRPHRRLGDISILHSIDYLDL